MVKVLIPGFAYTIALGCFTLAVVWGLPASRPFSLLGALWLLVGLWAQGILSKEER